MPRPSSIIGNLQTLEDCKSAIRDLESALVQMIVDPAPASGAQLLMLDNEGNIRAYTLQSGGGCSVNINNSTRVVSISVP